MTIWEASMLKWIGVAALAAFILAFGGHFGTCFTPKAHAAAQRPQAQVATDLSARRHYRHYRHYRYAYRPYYYGSPYYYGPGPFFPFVPFFGFGWGPGW
jgi:hypothetical protein